MAEKNDSKRIREIVAGFDELPENQRPSVKEIVRRLKEDECGVGHRIEISPRAVYYHRTEHRLARARAETDQDTLDKSIAAAKQQAVDLLTRELHEITSKTRPGQIKADRIPVIERIHKALSNMEKTEARAANRPVSKNSDQQPEHQESTMERIARQAREVPSPNGSPQAQTPQAPA